SLGSSDAWVRAWTIQLAIESSDSFESLLRDARQQEIKIAPVLDKLATSDPSPEVRLAIASAAQRMGDETLKTTLLTKLLAHGEDAKDHNLPLMIWFAMEPLVPAHPAESLALALETKLPKILNFVAHRIAALGSPEARNLLTQKLRGLAETKQLDILA